MIKSELVQKIAERNPHLYQRDVENIVNAILDAIYQSSLGKAVDKTELNESSEKLEELEKFIKEVPLNTEEKSDTGFSD